MFPTFTIIDCPNCAWVYSKFSGGCPKSKFPVARNADRANFKHIGFSQFTRPAIFATAISLIAIVCLLCSGSPTAVHGPMILCALWALTTPISTIVINSVNRMTWGGSGSEGCGKGTSVIFPTLAHGPTVPAIFWICLIMRIKAARLNALPNTVNTCMPQSMFQKDGRSVFLCKATARLRTPVSQVARINRNCITTIADTLPMMLASFIFGVWTKNKETTKAFTSHIFSNSHFFSQYKRCPGKSRMLRHISRTGHLIAKSMMA